MQNEKTKMTNAVKLWQQRRWWERTADNLDFKVSAKRSFSNRLSQSNGESVELHTVLCILC